jgi:hypothetical protein
MDILSCIIIMCLPIQLQVTSIYTGATPSTHGIVGNDWFNKATGKDIYCTDDASVKTIEEKVRKMSSLLSTTITDELRMATNF